MKTILTLFILSNLSAFAQSTGNELPQCQSGSDDPICVEDFEISQEEQRRPESSRRERTREETLRSETRIISRHYGPHAGSPDTPRAVRRSERVDHTFEDERVEGARDLSQLERIEAISSIESGLCHSEYQRIRSLRSRALRRLSESEASNLMKQMEDAHNTLIACYENNGVITEENRFIFVSLVAQFSNFNVFHPRQENYLQDHGLGSRLGGAAVLSLPVWGARGLFQSAGNDLDANIGRLRVEFGAGELTPHFNGSSFGLERGYYLRGTVGPTVMAMTTLNNLLGEGSVVNIPWGITGEIGPNVGFMCEHMPERSKEILGVANEDNCHATLGAIMQASFSLITLSAAVDYHFVNTGSLRDPVEFRFDLGVQVPLELQ